jgi:hypothetical protein
MPMALWPRWGWRGVGLLLTATSGPSPWYVWFPSWLSGLSALAAITAAATAYITWRRSGFTTQGRATIDRRRTAIRVEIANTGRMDAAVDSIRLWEATAATSTTSSLMSPPTRAPRDVRIVEGIYILELSKPLNEWAPVPLPPGRTLHATLTAGLPKPTSGKPGPPKLPPLSIDLHRHKVRVVFGNGTMKDLPISESVLDAYDRATVGILAGRETGPPRRRPGHLRTF